MLITFLVKRLIVDAQNHIPIVVGLGGENRALFAVDFCDETFLAIRLNNLAQNSVVIGQLVGNFFADKIHVAVADNQSVFRDDERFAVAKLVHAFYQIMYFGKVKIERDDRFFVGQHFRHRVTHHSAHCVDIRSGDKNFSGIFCRAFIPEPFLRVIIVGHIEIGNDRPIFSRDINVEADAARQIFLLAFAPV